MEIRKFDVNGHHYDFVCESFDTRSGFGHKCELIKDDSYRIGESKRFYLNRTWECYKYQSAMLDVVQNEIDSRIKSLEDEFKKEKGYKLINAKRRKEFDEFAEKHYNRINEMKDLKKLVSDAHFAY